MEIGFSYLFFTCLSLEENDNTINFSVRIFKNAEYFIVDDTSSSTIFCTYWIGFNRLNSTIKLNFCGNCSASYVSQNCAYFLSFLFGDDFKKKMKNSFTWSIKDLLFDLVEHESPSSVKWGYWSFSFTPTKVKSWEFFCYDLLWTCKALAINWQIGKARFRL